MSHETKMLYPMTDVTNPKMRQISLTSQSSITQNTERDSEEESCWKLCIRCCRREKHPSMVFTDKEIMSLRGEYEYLVEKLHIVKVPFLMCATKEDIRERLDKIAAQKIISPVKSEMEDPRYMPIQENIHKTYYTSIDSQPSFSEISAGRPDLEVAQIHTQENLQNGTEYSDKMQQKHKTFKINMSQTTVSSNRYALIPLENKKIRDEQHDRPLVNMDTEAQQVFTYTESPHSNPFTRAEKHISMAESFNPDTEEKITYTETSHLTPIHNEKYQDSRLPAFRPMHFTVANVHASCLDRTSKKRKMRDSKEENNRNFSGFSKKTMGTTTRSNDNHVVPDARGSSPSGAITEPLARPSNECESIPVPSSNPHHPPGRRSFKPESRTSRSSQRAHHTSSHRQLTRGSPSPDQSLQFSTGSTISPSIDSSRPHECKSKNSISHEMFVHDLQYPPANTSGMQEPPVLSSGMQVTMLQPSTPHRLSTNHIQRTPVKSSRTRHITSRQSTSRRVPANNKTPSADYSSRAQVYVPQPSTSRGVSTSPPAKERIDQIETTDFESSSSEQSVISTKPSLKTLAYFKESDVLIEEDKPTITEDTTQKSVYVDVSNRSLPKSRVHDILNKYSSIFIENLKDPIPKDPLVMSRGETELSTGNLPMSSQMTVSQVLSERNSPQYFPTPSTFLPQTEQSHDSRIQRQNNGQGSETSSPIAMHVEGKQRTRYPRPERKRRNDDSKEEGKRKTSDQNKWNEIQDPKSCSHEDVETFRTQKLKQRLDTGRKRNFPKRRSHVHEDDDSVELGSFDLSSDMESSSSDTINKGNEKLHKKIVFHIKGSQNDPFHPTSSPKSQKNNNIPDVHKPICTRQILDQRSPPPNIQDSHPCPGSDNVCRDICTETNSPDNNAHNTAAVKRWKIIIQHHEESDSEDSNAPADGDPP